MSETDTGFFFTSSQVRKYNDEREQLIQTWEQEKAKMKDVEEELTTSNKNLQKKLEAQDSMEKEMNVSITCFSDFFSDLGCLVNSFSLRIPSRM